MLLQENSFNDEGSNKPIFVPRPSFTQQGVYDALYRLCWDENRFIGPGFEKMMWEMQSRYSFLCQEW